MSQQPQLPPLTFGPVPSRRFSQSLGLNTIPPKTCSYSCVYCQIGRTDHLTTRRERHCDPGELLAHVSAVVRQLQEGGERIDYLTFVPDGEPTLVTRVWASSFDSCDRSVSLLRLSPMRRCCPVKMSASASPAPTVSRSRWMRCATNHGVASTGRTAISGWKPCSTAYCSSHSHSKESWTPRRCWLMA